MKIHDLRSDTLTKPSKGMRKAIYDADVGDDVYGEDPTVNKLQEIAAGLTGKEDALFVTSGSLGNLIPIYLNCGKGNEILAHENSHIFHFELASCTALAGVMPIPVSGEKGIIKPENLKPKIRPDIYYMAQTRMIEIENTHNLEGGTCYSLEDLKNLYEFAKENNLMVHMDGARVFNAAAATGINLSSICTYTDTITFCLSKGLGAPVGSLLCGSSVFIKEARRIRKMLGGGMRQAGILAAAGIYALENNVEKITNDHDNAKMIAGAIRETDWAEIDLQKVETNILYFNTIGYTAIQITGLLEKRGILCSSLGENRIRMVTHLDITNSDTEEICKIIRELKTE